jgi:H+/Cl- antiporter ClcA
MGDVGRMLLILGAVLIIAGIVVILLGRVNLPLGRLPGDIVYRGKNSTFYFPIVTCLLLSVILSAVLWAINHFRR